MLALLGLVVIGLAGSAWLLLGLGGVKPPASNTVSGLAKPTVDVLARVATPVPTAPPATAVKPSPVPPTQVAAVPSTATSAPSTAVIAAQAPPASPPTAQIASSGSADQAASGPHLQAPAPKSAAPTAAKPTQVAPVAQAPKPAAPKPTAKPKPGQIILPNGVVYGDRRPNLPNRIVRIASPNIKLDTTVYEVYSPKGVWEVADYAAGHNYNSKNPGEGGNIVLAGHNNWRGEVFRYLEFLKPGDTIQIWTLDGKEYDYTVQRILKLQEAGASLAQRLQNGKVMDPTPFEQLTLITCWPYTTYTHRLIVIATPK